MLRRQSFTICFIMLVCVSSWPSPASASTIIRSVHFDAPEIDTTGSSVIIDMRGLAVVAGPGDPLLPVGVMRILLPQGEEVADVSAQASGITQMQIEKPVQHGRPAVPFSSAVPAPRVNLNPEIYGSSIPYPATRALHVTTQTFRGFNIALINVFPVTYTGAKNLLEFAGEITVTVETAPQPDMLERSLETLRPHVPSDRLAVVRKVDDASALHTYTQSVPFTTLSSLVDPSETFAYVIITNSTLESSFINLKTHKSRLGEKATIVLVEDIAVDYTGQDLQAKIREFIKDAYNNWETEYVLLGGDEDVIPHRGLYFNLFGDIEEDIPADQYFAGLTGSWNSDGDSRWGEPGEEDLSAEVIVGRAPADNIDEANRFISKLKDYEMRPVNAEVRRALMVGEETCEDPLTYGGDYKNEIKDGSSNHGYTTVGFPDQFSVDTLYDMDYGGDGWSKSTLISKLNDGRHIVNHVGHADLNRVMRMFRDDVSTDLTNDGNSSPFFILYTQGCYAGSFDNRWWDGTYDDRDCIGEYFINDNNGAVAFIGNSRKGYGVDGSTNGVSQRYDREFFDALFGEDVTVIGRAFDDSKDDVAHLINQTHYRYIYYALNLLGDPAMDIWTATPQDMDVTHPATIYEGEEEIEIRVEVDGSALENATVCVYSDSTYALEYTDSQGFAYADPEADGEGTRIVCVSHHNMLPYRSTITILPSPDTLVIHAEYLGFNYPEGDPWAGERQVEVSIDGEPATTPVCLEVPPGTTVSVSCPSWAELYENDAYFGHGPFDRWSDGGDRTHDVTVTGNCMLTVYFDPTLLSTRVLYIGAAIEDYADAGDTVLVSPGVHYPLFIPFTLSRSMTIIAEEGVPTPELQGHYSGSVIHCDGASDFRIGAPGRGLLFTGHSCGEVYEGIRAEGCSDFVIEANTICIGRDCCCTTAGILTSSCSDFQIKGNYYWGDFYCHDSWHDQSFTIESNYFGYAPDHPYNPYIGIRLCYSDGVGIYGNRFYGGGATTAIQIGEYLLEYGITDLQIGGTVEGRNIFSGFYCGGPYCPAIIVYGVDPSGPRIDAECNYWDGLGWDGIGDVISGNEEGRFDFVPWADSSASQTYVPFDPSLCTVTALPDEVLVCPAGDEGTLTVSLAVVDGLGNPIEGMWCDDVDLLWQRESYKDPEPCSTEESFGPQRTDGNGLVGVSWSELGGCDNRLEVSLDGVPLSDGADVLVSSPDMTESGRGIVDLSDFIAFSNIMYTTELCGDYNFDGVVNLPDFIEFASHYQHRCSDLLLSESQLASDRSHDKSEGAGLIWPAQRPYDSQRASDFRVGLKLDGCVRTDLAALEGLVSYDRTWGEPTEWDGAADRHILRLEGVSDYDAGRGLVRIVSLVYEDPVESSDTDLVGVLHFRLTDPRLTIEPEIESLWGITPDGEVIDLAGHLVELGGETRYEKTELAQVPMLESSENPTAGLAVIRFGAPVSEGARLKVAVYDVRGRWVGALHDGVNDGVVHTSEFGVTGGSIRVHSPGIYFLQLEIDGRPVKTEKVVLLG